MFTYAPSAWTDGIPVLEYIRFQLGDTDVDHAELMDEEIQGVLLLFDGAVKRATVECARGILAKLSRETDTTGVGITANRSQRFRQLEELIKRLETELSNEASPLFVTSSAELIRGQGR